MEGQNYAASTQIGRGKFLAEHCKQERILRDPVARGSGSTRLRWRSLD
jgi:hypothetical protein